MAGWEKIIVKKTLIAALGGIGAVGLLGACSNAPQTPRPCPEILIPADGAELTRFKPGAGRDIIDVLHSEKITGFAHGCTYDVDDAGAGEVVVEIQPAIESNIGPASTERVAAFEYFIAVTDRQKNILDKARFPLTIPFPQNQSRLQWQRPESVVLRLPVTAGQMGDHYRIYLGLQVTPDELRYQREQR